ncbi:hypothetical protein AN641_02480 [Candidatus Epulonipiscioides gigas]|nr:hypothetical protein AN641_02480 [Epulopiscium sp. SCG-C07WGA-EpuloA2]
MNRRLIKNLILLISFSSISVTAQEEEMEKIISQEVVQEPINKDKIMEMLEIIKSQIPEIVVPEIVLQEVQPSEILEPEIVVPEIVLQEVQPSEILEPEIILPEIVLQEVQPSEILEPEIILPEMVLPEVQAPEIVLPEIEVPEIVIPDIAIPEIEVLSDDASFKPEQITLLPLEVKTTTVDLTQQFFYDNHNMSIVDLLNMFTIPSNPTILVESITSYDPFNQKYEEDIYQVVEKNFTLGDLRHLTSDEWLRMLNYDFTLELIIGSKDQLDYNNIRYLINVKTINLERLFAPTLYDSSTIENTEIEILSEQSQHLGEYILSLSDKYNPDNIKLKMELAQEYIDAGYKVRFYNGTFKTMTDLQNAIVNNQDIDITDKLKAGTFKLDNQTITTVLSQDMHNALLWPSISLDFVSTNQEVDDIIFEDLYLQSNNERIRANESADINTSEGIKTVTYILKEEYFATDDYYIGLKFDTSKVKKAVIGHFNKLADATNSSDIKEQLILGEKNIWNKDTGYLGNFNGQGMDFTIFDTNDRPYKITVKLDAQDSDSSFAGDFRITGFNGVSSDKIYIMPDDVDSSSKIYQTILIKDAALNISNLKPTFLVNKGANVQSSNTSGNHTSGTTAVDFSETVQYTVLDTDDTKNYWISAKKLATGPKLFVNGSATRELALSKTKGHDIFIANIGDKKLTGIEVNLQNAKNVKLDDYWSITKNSSLNAFTSATKPDNIAKIRLVAGDGGPISGDLIISADNQEPIQIELTGFSNNFFITTEKELSSGVKYVPYAQLIQTNNVYDWNKVTLSLIEDESQLPDGLIFKSNGEIYGVPTETGTFNIMVKAEFNNTSTDDVFEDSIKEFTFTIRDNTDANIESSISNGYEIDKYLPNVITQYGDLEFISEGEYDNFETVYINGEKLDADEYTVTRDKSGGTKIIILSKTFKSFGEDDHTLAIAFREDDNDLKITAQNYTVDIKSSGGSGGSGGSDNDDDDDDDDNNSGGNSGNSGSGSSSWWGNNSSTYRPTQPTIPEPEPLPPITVKKDVVFGAWYYEDVKWIYENGYMFGRSVDHFGIDELVTKGSITTALSLYSKIDLSKYPTSARWFDSSIQWANSFNLFGSNNSDGATYITREDMAVLIVNYLKYKGYALPKITNPVKFTDMVGLTAEKFDALQIMNHLGLFIGRGATTMVPKGLMTTQELAAVMKRMDALLNPSV